MLGGGGGGGVGGKKNLWPTSVTFGPFSSPPWNGKGAWGRGGGGGRGRGRVNHRPAAAHGFPEIRPADRPIVCGPTRPNFRQEICKGNIQGQARSL